MVVGVPEPSDPVLPMGQTDDSSKPSPEGSDWTKDQPSSTPSEKLSAVFEMEAEQEPPPSAMAAFSQAVIARIMKELPSDMTLGEVASKGMNSVMLETILTETMADRIHQQALQTPVSKSSKVTSPLTDDNNPTMGLDGNLPLRKEGVQSQFQSQPNSMPSATAATVAIQGGSNGHGQGFSDPSNQPGQSQTPGGLPSGNNPSNAGGPPPPPGPSGGSVPNQYGNPGGGGGSGSADCTV